MYIYIVQVVFGVFKYNNGLCYFSIFLLFVCLVDITVVFLKSI